MRDASSQGGQAGRRAIKHRSLPPSLNATGLTIAAPSSGQIRAIGRPKQYYSIYEAYAFAGALDHWRVGPARRNRAKSSICTTQRRSGASALCNSIVKPHCAGHPSGDARLAEVLRGSHGAGKTAGLQPAKSLGAVGAGLGPVIPQGNGPKTGQPFRETPIGASNPRYYERVSLLRF
jgi:hypothetical protein